MFDYRIFYPQIGIDEQNRLRRSAIGSSTRVYQLAAVRRGARRQGGRR